MRDDPTIMKEKICETLLVDIRFNKSETITIGTMYRSPSNDNLLNLDFMNTLSPILKILRKSSHTIIMGDLRGAFNKFPDCFCVDTFINRTHKNSSPLQSILLQHQ